MIDKTINDVPLKKLTFQTGQTKWDGGSKNISKFSSLNLMFSDK